MNNSRRPVSAYDIDLAREMNAAQRRKRAGSALRTLLAYASIIASGVIITLGLAQFASQFESLAIGILLISVLILWSGFMGLLYLLRK